MSHLNHAQFNAAFIHAEEIVVNVCAQIEKLNLRTEVMEKLLKELEIDELKQELNQVHIHMNYEALDKFKRIANRANSYLSAIDSYVALNFDLEITDYHNAIAGMSEYIAGSSNEIINEAMSKTEDELLKTFIRSISKSENHLDSKSLLEAAMTKMKSSKLYNKKVINNTKLLFERRGIAIEVNETQNLFEVIETKNKEQNEKIVNKEVRNRVLTSIIKIIKEQGFNVRKENVEECGDHAKIYAIKPNGEQVNFAVYLDGKFIYKFHEYEGLSCEKDIKYFEEKFESIYGIKIEDKKTFWSNPDKIGKQGHQTINKREK